MSLPNDNPFCYIQLEYLPVILLSLLIDKVKYQCLLQDKLGIDVDDMEISIICKEPSWHKERNKNIESPVPHPWGIEGTVLQEIFDRLVKNSISHDYDDEHKELTLSYLGAIMISDIFSDIEATPKVVFSLIDVLLCSDIYTFKIEVQSYRGQVSSLEGKWSWFPAGGGGGCPRSVAEGHPPPPQRSAES